jgi:dihydrofolate reductase
VSVTVMAAIARNGVIGREGAMPWHLHEDMARFRRLTMGHVLVMGRRTYESIGRPLPGRTTIVVTHRPDWAPAGGPAASVHPAADLESALGLAESLGTQTFVQGGAQIYAQALPRADRLLITWVDDDPAGDTLFPEVDWRQWIEVARESFPGGTWASYDRRDAAAISGGGSSWRGTQQRPR